MARDATLAWLLGEDQPSMRYLALTRLLDREETDPDVAAAREAIPRRGWAADILARQRADGTWVSPESLYRPKYTATNWMLLLLSDLGVTREDPRVAQACEVWVERFAKPDGGFGLEGGSEGHVCIAGNTARALVKLGYADDARVRKAFRRLAEHADPKGGWNCFGKGRNLDSWEPLSAFAVYPRDRWTAPMRKAVEQGCEFFLERRLDQQGARYDPWYRFHEPAQYYYDLLVGLDFMTALGHGADARLQHAWDILEKKKTRAGRWRLDAVHPDVEGAYARHIEAMRRTAPHRAPRPFALEQVGRPSKMVTLRARLVEKRMAAIEPTLEAPKPARGRPLA